MELKLAFRGVGLKLAFRRAWRPVAEHAKTGTQRDEFAAIERRSGWKREPLHHCEVGEPAFFHMPFAEALEHSLATFLTGLLVEKRDEGPLRGR